MSGGETFIIVAKPETLANSTCYAGWHDSITAAEPVDGVYFRIIGAVADGRNSANSVRTSTPTSYTLTNGAWYTLGIDVNDEATEARFVIYDEDRNLLWEDTAVGNIPTGAGRQTGVGIVWSSDTNSANIGTIDLMMFGWSEDLNR
jgi:hypothetical protein